MINTEIVFLTKGTKKACIKCRGLVIADMGNKAMVWDGRNHRTIIVFLDRCGQWLYLVDFPWAQKYNDFTDKQTGRNK